VQALRGSGMRSRKTLAECAPCPRTTSASATPSGTTSGTTTCSTLPSLVRLLTSSLRSRGSELRRGAQQRALASAAACSRHTRCHRSLDRRGNARGLIARREGTRSAHRVSRSASGIRVPLTSPLIQTSVTSPSRATSRPVGCVYSICLQTGRSDGRIFAYHNGF
jgi:hypothetical protein